jgi:hypothetical protein
VRPIANSPESRRNVELLLVAKLKRAGIFRLAFTAKRRGAVERFHELVA